MNEYAEAVLNQAKSMIGWPYRLGGTTEAGIDCRGFVFRSFKMAGLKDLIGGWQPNVRAEVQWARANGRLREADATPEPGWPVFYSGPDGKGPNKLQHVGLVIEAPTPERPRGRAISALNPVEDVKEHALDKRGLTVFGYLEPDWPATEGDPPSVDPEPPVEPDCDELDAANEYIAQLEAETAALKAAISIARNALDPL